MKKFCVLSLILFLSFPIFSAEQNSALLYAQTGDILLNGIKKTGETVENVAKTIVEPILNPKAAVSRWFDYDPRLETGEKKNFNILPLFVSSPERGIGFGIKFAQKSLLNKNDLVHLQAIQTLKSKSAYRIKYLFPPDFFRKIGAEFEMGYENYGRFYYGLGNQTQKENESEYVPEFFDVKLPLLYGLSENISLGLFLNYENWKIIETGETGILRQELPSLTGKDGNRLYTSGFLVRWDSRNSKTDPSKGLFLEGNVEYSKKLFGSESDFTRYTLETRAFRSVFNREHHVFGVRLFMDYKNRDVPFYKLPELGGIFFNRGLIEGRFRDNLAVCGNWEYRLKIYQRLHWAFFVDAGNVFDEFRHIGFNRTKVTGGTGMRYYVPPGNLLLARIDGGYSTEGFQIYLTFDQPF